MQMSGREGAHRLQVGRCGPFTAARGLELHRLAVDLANRQQGPAARPAGDGVSRQETACPAHGRGQGRQGWRRAQCVRGVRRARRARGREGQEDRGRQEHPGGLRVRVAREALRGRARPAGQHRGEPRRDPGEAEPDGGLALRGRGPGRQRQPPRGQAPRPPGARAPDPAPRHGAGAAGGAAGDHRQGHRLRRRHAGLRPREHDVGGAEGGRWRAEPLGGLRGLVRQRHGAAGGDAPDGGARLPRPRREAPAPAAAVRGPAADEDPQDRPDAVRQRLRPPGGRRRREDALLLRGHVQELQRQR
mmetsp:Transcript_110482/g.237752  ORF Transcript_110482/g.237752 Transcript_110482/m.237752 type:complete len:303 (-) Transcript_110482:333-1241(-)